METIGLRELNQNPSRAVARVRAGESLLVTDEASRCCGWCRRSSRRES